MILNWVDGLENEDYHLRVAEVVEKQLAAGRDAMDRHAWREAFEFLSAADRAGSLASHDLESLATAAEWVNEMEICIDALERGYCAYLENGNRPRAAWLAMELARGHTNRGASAVSAGWRWRAETLLEKEPECVEHGHLLLRQGRVAQESGELDGALKLYKRATEIGTGFGDRDLWAQGTHRQGQLMLVTGDVAEGLRLVDEASAAAVGGEVSSDAAAYIYCWTISVCRDLADVKRAGEWTEATKRWCDKQSITGFPGVCKFHRAEILRLRGAWQQAELDAADAGEELSRFSPRVAGEAFGELGLVRLRMGNLNGAREAFDRAHELGHDAQPGRSLLKLRRGDIVGALGSIKRALMDESWDRLARARLLPAHVEIALKAGDLEDARWATQELERLFADYGGTLFEAAATQARGATQLAEGDAASASTALRRSIRLWQEVDAPYEGAQTRLLLAQAYRKVRDDDCVTSELRTAQKCFERLGAVLDAQATKAELAAMFQLSEIEEATQAIRTFLFSDIVQSTGLLEAIGDGAWGNLVKWHDRTLRALFEEHHGEEVDHAGDGFFVAFRDATAALDCAVQIQRCLAEHRLTHGFAPQVRIGIHAAQTIQTGESYKGKGVHEAARIMGLSGPDEVLVSEETLKSVGSGYPVSARRSVQLKGISRPLTVCSVQWSRSIAT